MVAQWLRLISARSGFSRDPTYRGASEGDVAMVGTEVTFSLLGPLRAWRGGDELDLGPPQQRGVLGLMLLNAGRPVDMEVMVDRLWGQGSPSTARETVRTYLSRLRRVLPAGDGGSLIESGRAGHALPVAANALDLTVFEDRRARARAARDHGDDSEAADLLRAALELWQGPALSGTHGKFVRPERARLDQLRVVALQDRIALDLELGRHSEVLAELASLVVTYPLQEKLHELQMLALYREARQADALAVYRDIRERLAQELGIEPGRGLRDLHQRILRADPNLNPPPAVAPALRPESHKSGPIQPEQKVTKLAVPRRLLGERLRERRDSGFVGRADERALFASALADRSAFVTLFLYGSVGIGKSALVRRLADDAAEAGRTVLQVDGRLIGSSKAEFVARTESATHESKVVLLLDSFEHCESLEPWLREEFLPQLPDDVLVVIASRNPPSLMWQTDATWSGSLRIEVVRDLAPADADALLDERGLAPELRRQAMRFVGGHPLALCVAAENAARDSGNGTFTRSGTQLRMLNP